MATLYVYAEPNDIHSEHLLVDLETLLVLNVYKLCDTGNIHLQIIPKKDLDPPLFRATCKFDAPFGEKPSECELTTLVRLPALIQDIQGSKSIVAGVCSVARQLLKSSGDDNTQFLLGFRESCLAACSESSIWTKFCEVDMIATVKHIFTDRTRSNSGISLPDDLLRFEYHMQQPVRMHNVYKVAREAQKDKRIKSTVPIADLKIPHCYSEGPAMTLSDIILFPCVEIIFRSGFEEVFKNCLPLTYQWMERMREYEMYDKLVDFDPFLGDRQVPKIDYSRVVINENIKKESLYSSDPNRYKPSSRVYTKQNDIENVLNVVQTAGFPAVENSEETFGAEVEFGWEAIPMILRPEGGALPKKRSKRKEEQLENLTKAVIRLTKLSADSQTKKNLKIVDFCSGSGHLGLLLAYLLPHCTIILVENKQKSMERALERIKCLNLTNVLAVQSNLDYFQGSFDIGVSLHACGVATDLAMQGCIDNRAHFVCCPCCYGGIHDCYHLKFPRSSEYVGGVSVDEYLKIAHAADQTHDKENRKTPQGYHCMDIIDSDRLLYGRSRGYEMFLGKLKPESCTPKNNLLVGVYRME